MYEGLVFTIVYEKHKWPKLTLIDVDFFIFGKKKPTNVGFLFLILLLKLILQLLQPFYRLTQR